MSEDKKFEMSKFEVYGLPWWQALACVVICATTMYLGVQSSSMTGTLATCFALAVVMAAL